MTAYLDAMRHYFDFSGRATRSQFWLYTLIYVVILLIAVVIDATLQIDPTGEAQVVSGIVALVHLIPSLAITVRRLHDINRSGWWVLIAFVPLIGLIVLLIFACTPSQPAAAGSAYHPAQAAAGSGRTASIEQLEKLSALRSSGAVSDEEFARMKAQILQQGQS